MPVSKFFPFKQNKDKKYREMLGELVPLRSEAKPASLSNKSRMLWYRLNLSAAIRLLCSPRPFDPFISQSAHMVLLADALASEPASLVTFVVFITPARAPRRCQVIKIAGIRIPELSSSMSSKLFVIKTTFLASAVRRKKKNTLARGHLQEITHQVLSRNFVYRDKRQPCVWFQLCWIYTLHSIIHIRCTVRMHRRVFSVHPVNNRKWLRIFH